MADQPTPTAAAGSPAPDAPMGVSSATGPTPNRGYEAAAKQRLGVVLRQLEQMVPLAGATTDLGKSILKALNDLAKHIQPGEVTPAAERNTLESAMMQNQQNTAMQQQMRAAQPPGGAPGGASSGAPGGARPPQAAA